MDNSLTRGKPDPALPDPPGSSKTHPVPMPTLPPATEFDAVVFDMDGTLIDSEGHYCNAYLHAMATLGGSLTQEHYFARFAGKTNAHIEEHLLAELPAGTAMQTLQSTWRSEFDRLCDMHGHATMPGVRDLLDHLAGRHLPLAVASAADLADILTSLAQAGIDGHFAAVASGQEVPRTKPAPDVYLLAAERLGVDPARCLAFEDTNAGARAAIAAGMHTFMVPHQCVPDEFVRARARGIAASLLEFVEPPR